MPLSVQSQPMIQVLEDLREQLRQMTADSPRKIGVLVKRDLKNIYTPKLAKKWTERKLAATGQVLSAVSIATTAKEVYGYEYGTAAHMIYPRTARVNRHGGVLAWPIPDPTSFAAFVHHPGTKAHNRRGQVQASLRLHAREVWQQALGDAFAVI